MLLLSALNIWQSRTGIQILFIEFNIVVNPVGIVWCLGFWVLVELESSESVPRRGYPRVS
jgi:hypothetical protein